VTATQTAAQAAAPVSFPPRISEIFIVFIFVRYDQKVLKTREFLFMYNVHVLNKYQYD